MSSPTLRRTLDFLTNLASPTLSDLLRDPMIDVTARAIADRVVTYRDLARRDGVRVWWFDRVREYEFTYPAFFAELPIEIERLIGIHRRPKPFVMEVPDIVIGGRGGQKMTPEGEYLVYNFWEPLSSRAVRSVASDLVIGISHGSLPPVGGTDLENLPKIDHAISLLATHDTNYTHWVQECLTLLEGLEEYVDRTGNRPVALIPPDPPEFVTDSLGALGYSKDDYMEWGDRRAHVRMLVLPSIRRYLSDTSDDYIRSAEAFDWVRDRVVESIEPTGSDYSKRVLISREDADTRRMVNREEVAEALAERGFELYVPGEMPYREQVRLFSRAEVIVGVHGAGLINAIYSTDSALLEIYGGHFLPANYELAEGQGRRYGCLRANPRGRDVHVDVGRLLEGVDRLEGA